MKASYQGGECFAPLVPVGPKITSEDYDSLAEAPYVF
jgi:hypothetical protein